MDCILIDAPTGTVKHVVLSVGGFLGIGEHHTAVPWSRLQFKTESAEVGPEGLEARTVLLVYVDATMEQLEKAPEFDPGKGKALVPDDGSDPFLDFWTKAETTVPGKSVLEATMPRGNSDKRTETIEPKTK